MQINVQFGVPLARTEPYDYVRQLEMSVTCYDQDFQNQYLVGKMAMDQILWADAQA